ncbi:MAG TPA: hypothetical protein VEF53_07645 [Patescibacteria group bacterium]|nr:hypothetical protein [Patescibacteria group bacterium]
MSKKPFTILVVAGIIIIAVTTIAAKPLKAGDVIGKSYYSDIKAFINEKPLRSVNADDKTMPAEATDIGKTQEVTSNTSHIISGKVIIPDGKVAPKGGLTVDIIASINPNPDPAAVSRAYGPECIAGVKYVIPEGKSTLDYKISVPVKFEPHYTRAILPDGELAEPVKAPEVKPNYVLIFRYSYYLGNYKVEHGDYRKGYLDMSTGDKTGIDYTFVNIDLK